MANQPVSNRAMVASAQPSLTYKPIDLPNPEPNQILIKTSYVAQNPTDIQSFDSSAFGDNAVYGCDFVGEVTRLGGKVTRFKLGDTLAGLIWGGEIKGLGGYADYTVADEKIAFKVPENFDHAAASTIPLAATTAWLALFSKDCLGMDRAKKQSVLIWGGSSSVGQYAIQIAKHYSYNVIATASPKNFDLVKSLGADHVFDYNSSDVVQQIQEAAPDLHHVVDTIGNKTSSALACQGARDDCSLCTVRPGKANTENVPKSVRITDVLVWTAFLKDHCYGEFHWPPHREDHELSAELFEKLPQWIEDGTIKPNATMILNGLESVPEGFQRYRDGKISAQKVVYRV